MGCHPVEPSSKLVWVLASGGHGPPDAGVVVAWQPAPVHNANAAAAWSALVLTTPAGDNLAMSWVGAERLVELRDPSPADGPG